MRFILESTGQKRENIFWRAVNDGFAFSEQTNLVVRSLAKINISEAFRRLGAKLKNPRWSVSAFNDNDELVVSLWAHHLDKLVKGKLVFRDRFDRWKGPGNREFRRNLISAYKNGINIGADPDNTNFSII